jgi:hypothetical protein
MVCLTVAIALLRSFAWSWKGKADVDCDTNDETRNDSKKDGLPDVDLLVDSMIRQTISDTNITDLEKLKVWFTETSL